MGEKKEEVKEPVAEPEPEPEPEPAPVIAEPIAHEELPALPDEVKAVDDLFELVPAGEKGMYVIVRHPDTFLGYADQLFKTYDKPLAALAAAAADGPEQLQDASEAQTKFAEGKTKYDAAASKIKESGIDWSHGVVFSSSSGKSDDMVALFVAENADAFKELMVALDADDAEKLVCGEIPKTDRKGCADSKKALSSFKPGDAKKHREAAEQALPGVSLDDANIIAHVQDNSDGPIYLAMTTPPGTGIFHVSLPTKDKELAQAVAMFTPAKGKTLRYAQPGAGFMWANVDTEKVKAMPGVSDAPPPLDSVVKGASGEFFLGGSVDPAGFQFHAGITDASTFESLIEIAAMAKDGVPKEIPDVPGSKIAFGREELELAGANRKALHIAVSGIKEAAVLAQLTGLTLDGWYYATEDTASLALGFDQANLQKLAATEGDGLSEWTRITLPTSLVESYDKGEISMIAHVPVDSLQSPQLRDVVKAGLKNVEMVKPALVESVLDLMAPLSSSTMWMTESESNAVVHFAVRGIGNSSTEEGKEALAAMERVLAGGSRQDVYGALATKYPATAHTNAYKIRGGIESRGTLAGSGVGLAVGAAAIGVALAMKQVNESLAEDLGVTLEAPKPEKKAVEKKPVTKKPAEKKPTTKEPTTKEPEKEPETATRPTIKKKEETKEPEKEPEKKPEVKKFGLKVDAIGRKN